MNTLVISDNGSLSLFFQHWYVNWRSNKNKILKLTLINSLNTILSEYLCRSLLSSTIFNEHGYEFFINGTLSITSVNKQSLINLFMTIMASLLAGPIYFFSKRKDRLLFFLIFGAINSFQAQYLASLIRSGSVAFESGRFFFDLFYTLFFRFPIFEIFRNSIVREGKFVHLFGQRGKQDLLSTLIKTGLLNIFKISG